MILQLKTQKQIQQEIQQISQQLVLLTINTQFKYHLISQYPMDGNLKPIISLFANIWLCKKIRQKISVQIVQKQHITLKAYVMFFLSVIFLIGFNQALFLYTEKPNLYEEIQLPRSSSLSQAKKWGDQLKVKIMTFEHIPLRERMNQINKVEGYINVLSHPARRLTYDAFGQTGVEYAWAFMSQHFLLQSVLQSAIFYIICTIMSLVNSKKADVKVTLKTEILVMILLFVWQIDIIMSTETKLHGDYSDFLDRFYFALPMFERREMLKSILIPAMNMVDIFVIFFVQNAQVTKIKKLGLNPQFRTITNQVSASIPSNVDPNRIEDEVGVKIKEIKQKDEFRGEVFRLNRQILKSLFFLNIKTLLPTPQIRRINAYFKLPYIQQIKPMNQAPRKAQQNLSK